MAFIIESYVLFGGYEPLYLSFQLYLKNIPFSTFFISILRNEDIYLYLCRPNYVYSF
ncbi:hypothetical protein HMPREF1981_00306 [Bacteroides pyogenes F0041]|uniref:Uncharacterized protein n=1 Tax=Bacteroides pyogenes F0041 TaxID=1321819 RepID=U2CE77_9BACE|nr:hypothetical protein HMPREF1981_00306 [Bacteroides pyogenes F0041]